MISENRLKAFIEKSLIEVYLRDSEIISIGLKFGYSKYMEQLGFKRKEQIEILNFLEKQPILKLKELGLEGV